MDKLPNTSRAWRRLKLAFAEYLVLSIPLQNHHHNYDLIQAADKIRDLRERHYEPRPLTAAVNAERE